jgi:RNA polymerase sigma-70 factor (ECF subfamily)
MTPSLEQELRLLAGIQRLDPQALAEVHETYYAAIFRYIAYRIGDQNTAEDLTSEVFTRLIVAVRDRSAPRNTLRGWLYGVASRVVADHYRHHYRAEHVELTADLPGEHNPETAVFHRFQLEELGQALRELTDEQQNVIALRFGYEMPIRDVAEMMGKSEGAVKQLQARAVSSLARLLSRGESS